MHTWAMPLTLSNRAPKCSRKDLQGGVHNSKITAFGRAMFSWLGIDTNGTIIRNFSLTLGDIADCFAKALSIQQRSLNSQAELF